MSFHPPNDTIRLEVVDRVGKIVLNRPEAANSRNQEMRAAIAATCRHLSAQDGVHVVILTGAGDRHFCAGMDLKEAGNREAPAQRRARMRRERDIELLAGLPQPTLAVINGHALGGGLEMAMACDLRIAVDDARLGLPEVEHGLMPGGGGTVRLPRLVGLEQALEMLLLGRVLTGSEAAKAGLVSRSVPRAALDDEVTSISEALASKPPTAARAIKDAIYHGLAHEPTASLERELDGLLWLLAAKSETTQEDAG